MRKLASIQRIVELSSIPEADKIEVCVVLGWKCIVKKGEFKVGDLVVYIEPDSMLPINPWTGEKLADKPLRLKTVRMKKQISQGLVIALPTFEKLYGLDRPYYSEGDDISELSGITKYEPPPLPACLSGLAKGNFPSFIPKTDETRIQACPAILSRWSHLPFSVTEKLDGMSTTYYWHDAGTSGVYEFGACSRNLDLKSGDSVQFAVANELKIEAALADTQKAWGCSISVQGELTGPNIQGNRLNLAKVGFHAFNLFNITTQEYLPPWQLLKWCRQYNIPHVPVISDNFSLVGHTVDSLIAMATAKSTIDPKVWMEGMVFRPLVEQRDPDVGRLSFKAISPEFLLRHGE